MADKPLTVAKVAEILSTPGWQMSGGQGKSELGLLIGQTLDVLEAQAHGSNLLVTYRKDEGGNFSMNRSVLWSNCRRPDGSHAMILAYPCRYAFTSGNASVIRVSGRDPDNTVMVFTRTSTK